MKIGVLPLLLILPSLINAQCMLYPVSLDQRIELSDILVEGTVLSSRTERLEDNHIYTIHQVEIFKVFKGELSAESIEIQTRGGMLENSLEVVTPSLQLHAGASGLFFIERHLSHYRPYSGPQGFIAYNLENGTAYDPFSTYASIETDLYVPIVEKLSIHPKIIKKNSAVNVGDSKAGAAGPISSFSPSSITAGTRSILTITGSNFGVSRGTGRVEFQNASSGPNTVNPQSAEYISWTDNEIKVYVPSAAGTGIFRVVKNGNSNSGSELKIDYAQLNVLTTNGFAYKVAHINDNNKGGYDWRFSNDFASNNNAKNTFVRAMDQWREATCVNWELIENTPSNTTTNDGTNIIRFASPNELPNGVLATTSSYYQSCAAGTVWYVEEIDMTYSTDVNWNFAQSSPKSSEYDMESVTIHELGHAHQLGHVIDPQDIMHRSIGPGQTKRKLTLSNIVAGNFVQAQSLEKNPCGPSEMINFPGCTSTIGIVDQNDISESYRFYPNPVKNELNLYWEPTATEAATAQVFDIEGRKIVSTDLKLGRNTIDCSLLANGMYLLVVESAGRRSFNQFIVQP